LIKVKKCALKVDEVLTTWALKLNSVTNSVFLVGMFALIGGMPTFAMCFS
jgi:hypothetical protein